MTQLRHVQTCVRCREAKRRCDKARPSCTRCERAGVPCTYDDHSSESSPLSEGFDERITHGANTPVHTELSSTDSSHGRIVKKRARAVLSCTRCHRLKVRCDKAQPCGRCVRSGYESTCIYTHKAKPVEKPCSLPPSIPSGRDPEFIVATWFLRRRGSSHWKALLNRVSQVPIYLIPRMLIVISWSHFLVSMQCPSPYSPWLCEHICKVTAQATLHCQEISHLGVWNRRDMFRLERCKSSWKIIAMI